VITAIIVFAFAAGADALAARAQHFGWAMLVGVVVAAAAGY
jgi:hypothetical protein